MVEVNGAPPTLEEARICYLVSERVLSIQHGVLTAAEEIALKAIDRLMSERDAYAKALELYVTAARVLEDTPRFVAARVEVEL